MSYCACFLSQMTPPAAPGIYVQYVWVIDWFVDWFHYVDLSVGSDDLVGLQQKLQMGNTAGTNLSYSTHPEMFFLEGESTYQSFLDACVLHSSVMVGCSVAGVPIWVTITTWRLNACAMRCIGSVYVYVDIWNYGLPWVLWAGGRPVVLHLKASGMTS